MKFLMCLVTVHTRHGARLVRAASPEKLISTRVALQAGKVLLSHCVFGIFSKTDWNRILGTTGLDVNTTRTMAGFAAASLVGIMRMRHCLSHCCSIEASPLILMTGNTRIAPDVVDIGLRR
jgi:hypothetical protein